MQIEIDSVPDDEFAAECFGVRASNTSVKSSKVLTSEKAHE